MIQNVQSAWRYPAAVVGGLVSGGYVGAMAATIYVMIAMKEALATLKLTEPWFVRYSLSMLEGWPEVLYTALLITAAVPIAFIAIGVSGVYRGALTTYDTAHWQSKAEIRKNKMSAPLRSNAFIYAKTVQPKRAGDYITASPDRFPHAIMVAPTGRGKGVGFVLPNLLNFDGSAIVLDVKGENFEITSVHRKKGLGNEIYYFSPFDYQTAKSEDGSEAIPQTRTHRFNPLARIAAMPTTDQQYTALNTLADLFLTVEGDSAKGFYQSGKRLFIASCLFAIEQNTPTLGQASEIMGGGGNRAENYREYAELTKNPTVQRIFLEMAGETQKIVDSYISVINGAGFQLWNDPSVVKATSDSDFDFSTFRKEKQTLYISVQSEHLITLAPLIRLLFADAISSLQRAEPGPDEPHAVMFLMDEFDQLGYQPLVLNSLKTIRSFRGRFFIITQSIPGLDTVYGETGRLALLAGAGIKIFMTPQEERTAEILSSMLGKTTIESRTESQSRIRDLDDSANISRRNEERPLKSPGELLQYPLSKVMILPEGQYPIEAWHIRYYEDHHFKNINDVRDGHALPYPPLTVPAKPKFGKLSAVTNLVKKANTTEQVAKDFGNLADKAEESKRPDQKQTKTPSAKRRGRPNLRK